MPTNLGFAYVAELALFEPCGAFRSFDDDSLLSCWKQQWPLPFPGAWGEGPGGRCSLGAEMVIFPLLF